MNWEAFEEKEIPFACDKCGKVIKPFAKFYYCGGYFAHPDCKDELESRLKELIKGN